MDKKKLTIEDFRQLAKKVMPQGAEVWLYGSRARGEAKEDSDWDLLILLDQPIVTSADEDLYAYPFVDLGWDYASAVSPQIYTYKDWNRISISPFYRNVEHDKVRIA